jgi:SAM-dependent methyltransferase
MGLADAGHVREQYRDTSRLDTRVGLYERFGRHEEPWYDWLLRQLGPLQGERILDVGAGSAGIWRANTAVLPAGLRLALVDRSPAMLVAGRERGAAELCCAGADAQALPFRDETFDALLAAHMLYHVGDRSRALSEMRRVLRPGGRLCVATNAWTHLIELRELAGRFGLGGALFAVGRSQAGFDVECAADEVHAVFGAVRVELRRSVLEITEAAPAVDYVRSVLPEGGSQHEEPLEAFRREVARRIEVAGSFPTVACAGVVVTSA